MYKENSALHAVHIVVCFSFHQDKKSRRNEIFWFKHFDIVFYGIHQFKEHRKYNKKHRRLQNKHKKHCKENFGIFGITLFDITLAFVNKKLLNISI